MSDSARPFDRAAVARHRARAAPAIGAHDFLFTEFADRLVDRLGDLDRGFARALDLGCHGGTLAARLKARPGAGLVVQCDLAPEMARAARAANGVPTLACDEELLPFAPASFDLVASVLSLHWVNDLPGALAQIRRALVPDGLFIAALLGAGTLGELRDALMAAELAVESGASPRISPFADTRDGGDLLARAGFALPVADRDRVTVSYAGALDLMRDLRAMGEANAVALRRKGFTRRATLGAAAAHYPTGADGRITASFEVIWLAGWAPGPGQQAPLRPGSARARLADALGTTERDAGDAVPRRPGRQKNSAPKA